MILVPALRPVTTPVGLTVATAVLDEVQGFTAAGVPDPLRAVVAPAQMARLPVIVG